MRQEHIDVIKGRMTEDELYSSEPAARKPTYKAYLAAVIKSDGTPCPKVDRVAIFSSSSPTMMRGEVFSVIMVAEGGSFQEARDKIMETVDSIEHYKWMKFWLSDTLDAHVARGVYTGVLK